MAILSTALSALINNGAEKIFGKLRTASRPGADCADYGSAGTLILGRVVRASAGYYDAVVVDSSRRFISCNVATDLALAYFGAQDCFVPPVGSEVVVWLPQLSASQGTILCSYPGSNQVASVRDGKEMQRVTQLWDMEPGVSHATDENYRLPYNTPADTHKQDSGSMRPVDVLPGDKVTVNEQGVGIAILRFLAALRGSDRAKIEVSAIDDMVRLVSGYFRHVSAQGVEQVYNDGGYVTSEQQAAMYQFERSGCSNYGTKIFDDKGRKHKFIDTADAARVQAIHGDAVPVSRFQRFLGFLGNLVSLTVLKPKTLSPGAPETASQRSRYQGLAQVQIMPSGRILVRSATGISLQRDDRIAVPKRLREPWDPEGYRAEDDSGAKPLLPYNWPSSHPSARALVLRDAMAWYNRQIYQRFREHAKDWYVPLEAELDPVDDTYDDYSGSRENQSANANKRAYFNIEADGSVIFRDAWGSEIVMSGGNITFNAAGNIHVRSGKSVVALGGDDVIIKAKHSIDVTATDNDVRIKADKNLHMLAEGRNGGGGILLESKSSTASAPSGTGEASQSSGVVIHAPQSGVLVSGRRVNVHGQQLRLDTKTSDNTAATGNIFIAARNVSVSADRYCWFGVNKTAAIAISRNSAIISGPRAYVIGGRGVAVTEGQKAWIPYGKVDIIGTPPYQQIETGAATLYTNFQMSASWLRPWTPSAQASIQFTYRTSAEYGTLKASEVYGATEFRIYQASWAQMMSGDVQGSKFISGTKEVWVEYPIGDTYAWPGKTAYEGSAYVVLETEPNIGDRLNGITAEKVSPDGGQLKVKKFSDYEVMKA